MQYEEIKRALEVLSLPTLITKEEIKDQYRYMVKKYHPDKGGKDAEKIKQINSAYALLMRYIEEFRYTFDEDEVAKQLPKEMHDSRYRR